jgi:hypothetical protein
MIPLSCIQSVLFGLAHWLRMRRSEGRYGREWGRDCICSLGGGERVTHRQHGSVATDIRPTIVPSVIASGHV